MPHTKLISRQWVSFSERKSQPDRLRVRDRLEFPFARFCRRWCLLPVWRFELWSLHPLEISLLHNLKTTDCEYEHSSSRWTHKKVMTRNKLRNSFDELSLPKRDSVDFGERRSLHEVFSTRRIDRLVYSTNDKKTNVWIYFSKREKQKKKKNILVLDSRLTIIFRLQDLHTAHGADAQFVSTTCNERK